MTWVAVLLSSVAVSNSIDALCSKKPLKRCGLNFSVTFQTDLHVKVALQRSTPRRQLDCVHTLWKVIVVLVCMQPMSNVSQHMDAPAQIIDGIKLSELSPLVWSTGGKSCHILSDPCLAESVGKCVLRFTQSCLQLVWCIVQRRLHDRALNRVEVVYLFGILYIAFRKVSSM